MFIRLLLLLTVVPFVELVILLRLADAMGWANTVALILLTGVVGAFLARREGLKAFLRIRDEMSQGILPADALINGVLILAAGLLLVTPGVLTDLVGFAVLIGPLRRRIAHRIHESVKARIVVIHRPDQAADPFVDVEATGRDAQPPANSRGGRDLPEPGANGTETPP